MVLNVSFEMRDLIVEERGSFPFRFTTKNSLEKLNVLSLKVVVTLFAVSFRFVVNLLFKSRNKTSFQNQCSVIVVVMIHGKMKKILKSISVSRPPFLRD